MRVAVVGSGVSGLAATWLLNEYSDHEVHVFEADDRVGGHAETVLFERAGKESVDVDRGFSVFNLSTYPNFSRFLQFCDIPMHGTAMSFSFSRDKGALEWSGKRPWSLFCQPSNLFRIGMWRMIWDIIRFNALASRAVRNPKELDSLSLGTWLQRHSFSHEFVHDYLLPITASIWSTPPDTCALEFPAHAHFRFMHNHHFLQLTNKPPWMSIKGGSKLYVDRIISKLPAEQLHLCTPIDSVTPSLDGSNVLLTTVSGETAEFDHVLLATHTDISLQILKNGKHGATGMEEKVLGAFQWSRNRVVVHHDEKLMPLRKSAWSCWNFVTTTEGANASNVDPVCL
ncbi:hypothetical protein FRB96_006951 [Tulasnella sp. 330]|nr:hypothetical protein FRB96_006951 [Tulasnella sp. 330]